MFKKKTWDHIQISDFHWIENTTQENYGRDKAMHEQEIGWELARKLALYYNECLQNNNPLKYGHNLLE